MEAPQFGETARPGTQKKRTGRKKDWRRTIGAFQDDQDFEEAIRLGRKFRQAQTCQRELAGS